MRDERLLLLVRDGSVDESDERLWGRTDVSLSTYGRREVNELATMIAAFTSTLIVSSPQLRARQTAFECARRAHALAIVDDRLDELDFGDWTGFLFDELASDARWQAFNRCRELTTAPQGEGAIEVRSRVLAALDEYVVADVPGPLVFVTHAEVIRILLLESLGLSVDDWWRLRVDPASVTLFSGSIHHPLLRVRGINLRAADLETELCAPSIHAYPRSTAASN